jgi:hypothetical protein
MNFESFPKNNSEKKEEKKPLEIDTRKAALFGAAMMASVGATELHAAENISSDTDGNRIEMASTDHSAIEDVAAINFMDAARDFSATTETGEEEKGKGGTTEASKEKGKETALDDRSKQLMEEVFDAGFPMGKADLSPQERLSIKNDFAKFAASIPQEVRDNPQKYKVVIEAYASKHKIAETGVDTGKRGRVSTNKDLALFRAQEALEVWKTIEQENLAPQGIQVSVETSEDGVYHGDLGAAIQEGRMIKISIEVIKESPAAKIVKEGITALGDLSNVSFVIIDRSPSMKTEGKQVEQIVNKFNQNTEGEIMVLDLETENGSKGSIEDHILSLEKALDNISEAYGEEKLGFIITDEFQNKKYEDSEARINNLIAKAKSLNIKLVIQRYQDGDTNKFSVKEITPLNVLGKIKKATS